MTVSEVAKNSTLKNKDCLFNLENERLLMFLVKFFFFENIYRAKIRLQWVAGIKAIEKEIGQSLLKSLHGKLEKCEKG